LLPHRILSRLKEYFFTPKNSVASCEAVAWQIQEMGGNIHFHQHIYATYFVGNEVCSIHAIDARTGELKLFQGDYFFSTVPVYKLMSGIAGVSDKAAIQRKEYYSNLFIIDKGTINRQIFKTLS